MLKHLKSRDDWNEKSFGAKGFTLIELLVVIIILGILAAVAIFAIGSIRENAEKSACETEVGTVETALAAALTNDPEFEKPSDAAGKIQPDQLDNLRKPTSHVEWSDVNDDLEVTSPC